MDILMPQLGETVAEGTIVKWMKGVGDAITSGETLFEIETDKTTMEIPSMTAGIVRALLLREGETAAVGTVVAVVEDAKGGEAEAGIHRDTPKEPVPDEVAATPRQSDAAAASGASAMPIDPFRGVRTPERNYGSATLPGGAKITPLARRLAAQAGIAVEALRGGGPAGRILAADVRKAVSAAAVAPSPQEQQAAVATPVAAEERDDVLSIYADTLHAEVPLDAMRKTIARRLILAKQTIPHFYLNTHVDIDRLLAFRAEINETLAPRIKISINDMVVKAFAQALGAVPAANAVWAGDRILLLQQVDIGIAVAVEGGLFTPVVRNVERMSLSALSDAIKDYALRAKERRLHPSEYRGGSASVSNLGMFGTREFSAIINPPQSSILAVGAAERVQTEGLDGEARFATRLSATLSCDHRVIDGALGAQLLAAFKEALEQPLGLVV
jgi:pyruvate dehydrogenase E2 component (dihydrolipoamide acetyltransferase)